jgi:glycosyltransferase involved in cell wall biosynthesis
MFSVSVVLPTIGRKSLENALNSIFDQTISPSRIFVIDDSKDQDIDFGNNKLIEVKKTGGLRGPSFSRNLGMGYNNSDWIAFLDDDDLWMPNHLESMLNFCTMNELDAGYSSAFINGKIRPVDLYDGTTDPLIAVYKRRNWLSTKMYFPTPGLVISRAIAEHLPFNNNLIEREDLWFAHKIYEYQFKVSQSSNPTVKINADKLRSISRTNFKSDIEWSERLELVSRIASRNFLSGIAFRNALLRKDWSAIYRISSKFSKENLLFRLIAKFIELNKGWFK